MAEDRERLVRELQAAFKAFLRRGWGEKSAEHLSHPGLDCRYGIELEFLASKNRYVIGNRVNSCMWNQNSEWWGLNFNALDPIDPNLVGDGKNLKNDNDFDQWSAFYLEATDHYGSASHKGDERCHNRGNAGYRIEYDGSVTLDRAGPGITLYSVKVPDRLIGTDLRTQHGWVNWALGLSGATGFFTNISDIRTEFTLNEGRDWIQRGRNDPLDLSLYNELVSNVLTNEHVYYPFKRRGGRDLYRGLLPLGGLSIDNLCNHLISHTTVIGVQRMGFHLHLSPSPLFAFNEEVKNIMLIGFVKLFYLFEPMLFAFHPLYRSSLDYCQSIQSIFTWNEIRNSDMAILDDLIRDIPIGGRSRARRPGGRYYSLNLKNCVPGGIGTIEIRLGHCTFDSKFIQAYINILTSLFQFNIMLLYLDAERNNAVFTSHNSLLDNFNRLIPLYCMKRTDEYNNFPRRGRIHLGNHGSPIYGFFESHGDGDDALLIKTDILKGLIALFQSVTGTRTAFSELIPMINYYHHSANTWINKRSLNNINVADIEAQCRRYLGDESMDRFNSFIPVTTDVYAINETGKSVLTHQCKTCSKNSHNHCKSDFNDGNYPIQNQERTRTEHGFRGRGRDLANENELFDDNCRRGQPSFFKLQSELINYKTGRVSGNHNFIHGGGKGNLKTRRNSLATHKTLRKRNTFLKAVEPSYKKLNASLRAKSGKMNSMFTQKRNRKSAETTKVFSQERSSQEEYELSYTVNGGAEKISVQNENGRFLVGYNDWMGGFTPNEELTEIISILLTEKIITNDVLDILLKYRYIDTYVYLIETDLHLRKLKEELAKFDILPDTIEKIRDVYKQIMSKKQNEPKQTINSSLKFNAKFPLKESR